MDGQRDGGIGLVESVTGPVAHSEGEVERDVECLVEGNVVELLDDGSEPMFYVYLYVGFLDVVLVISPSNT